MSDESLFPEAGSCEAALVRRLCSARLPGGGSAVGVRGDVVDLGPCGWDRAARDDAAAVAEGDRPALVGGEASFGSTELEDPAAVVEGDGLGAAGADHVPRRSERDGGVDAVGVSDTAAGREVGRSDTDHHGGCGAAYSHAAVSPCRYLPEHPRRR